MAVLMAAVPVLLYVGRHVFLILAASVSLWPSGGCCLILFRLNVSRESVVFLTWKCSRGGLWVQEQLCAASWLRFFSTGPFCAVSSFSCRFVFKL